MDSTFSHLFKLSEEQPIEFYILSRKSLVVETLENIKNLLRDQLNENDLKGFMLSVDEVLQNAYEHGNLELSNSDKKALLDEELLDEELKMRESKFFNRTITVKIGIHNKKLCLTITDQGKGFDWRKLILSDQEPTSLHGRGLSIVQAKTDEIEFNEAGNSVKLTKTIS